MLLYRDQGLAGKENLAFNPSHGTRGDLRVHRNVRDHEKVPFVQRWSSLILLQGSALVFVDERRSENYRQMTVYVVMDQIFYT